MKHLLSLLLFVVFCGGCALPLHAAAEDEFKCPNPRKLEKIIIDETSLDVETLRRWRTLQDQFSLIGFQNFFGSLPQNLPLYGSPILNEASAVELGIKLEVVKNTLSLFPATWLQNINSIIFQNSVAYIGQAYHIPTEPIIGATCYLNHGRVDIYLFKHTWTDMEVKKLLTHEIAHANDWGAHHRSFTERVHMAFEIWEQIQNKNRFSKMNPVYENNFYQMPLLRRTTEYWAEIVRFYFTDQVLLPEKDKKLVEKYLH